jgi:hypothetical protein
MDFSGRIASANRNADASYQKYNAYQQQADEAYGKYNNAFDKRQSFGGIYNAARDRYLNTDEINKARTSYQQARGAVDQLNDTINRMPDTIRQQYGGNLTQAQLSRVMQSRQGDNANTMNMLSQNYNNTLQDYTDLANRGMQETQYVAGNQMSDQEKTLDALRSVWSTLLGQRNSAYQMNQQDRSLLANEYGARDKWQLAQDQMALDRWKAQQENYRAKLTHDAQIEAARIGSYLPRYTATNNNDKKPTNNNTYTPRKRQQPIYATKANNFGDAIKMYGPLALFGGGSLWANKGIEDRWGGASGGNGGGSW